MTAPGGPNAPGALPPDPLGTLTGQPNQQMPITGYPLGTYPSPYYVDGPGCCGPLGRDGRIGYELYTFSGVDFPFGPTGLAQRLKVGWDIGASIRTLIFDPSHTSAWTIDLGGSFTHNAGQANHRPVNLFIRQPPIANAQIGSLTLQPDQLEFSAIKGVNRSSFNYNLGHDWWLWGRGDVGGMQDTNVRAGVWIGGRYGSAHVDVVPLNQVNGYARRQNAFEGITVGGHVSFDKVMGAWALFGGVRAEYGYDWLGLIPPLTSNLNSINLQIQLGIRY
jgi:hypothetical protein